MDLMSLQGMRFDPLIIWKTEEGFVLCRSYEISHLLIFWDKLSHLIYNIGFNANSEWWLPKS